jgi:hypothetical protein
MSKETVRQTLANLIQSELAVSEPAVAIHFANRPFNQPVNQPWVYVSIVDNETRRANLGNDRQFHNYGVVNCQISVPENSGTIRLKQIMDALEAILIDRQIPVAGGGSITLCHTRATERGSVNGWYGGGLMCEYRAWTTIER